MKHYNLRRHPTPTPHKATAIKKSTRLRKNRNQERKPDLLDNEETNEPLVLPQPETRNKTPEVHDLVDNLPELMLIDDYPPQERSLFEVLLDS